MLSDKLLALKTDTHVHKDDFSIFPFLHNISVNFDTTDGFFKIQRTNGPTQETSGVKFKFWKRFDNFQN